jgi:hypothetical protein
MEQLKRSDYPQTHENVAKTIVRQDSVDIGTITTIVDTARGLDSMWSGYYPSDCEVFSCYGNDVRRRPLLLVVPLSRARLVHLQPYVQTDDTRQAG